MRILMVGSEPTGRGGMSSVASTILADPLAAKHIRYVSTYRDANAFGRLVTWLQGWAVATAVLLTRRADVVHLHVSERSSVLRKGFLVFVAKLAGVPSVLHCHGAEFVHWHEGLPRVRKALVAKTFRSANATAVLGQRWRDDYVRLLGLAENRVHVVGNPVVVPESVAPKSTQRLHVLFLGRIGERKGAFDVLSAVAELGDEVRLWMAGDGETQKARAVAAKLDPRPRIDDWLDPVARDEALAWADVLVLPSHDEGLPMAILEAMAHGVVPVVSAVGAIGEVVTDGDTGRVVRPGDSDALAKVLAELAGDPDQVHALAGRARERMDDFAAGPYLARLRALWSSLRE